MKILTTLQSNQSYSAEKLAKMFQTSRRTIFRDLDDLHKIGVPYYFDNKTNGYVLDPEFFLPPLDLTMKEAMGLLLLVHNTAKHVQLPFKQAAILAAMKIENNLPIKLRKYCQQTLQNISTKTTAQTVNKQLTPVFECLQEAVSKKRRTIIQYQSLFEGQTLKLELSPYHLLYNNRAWYVIGLSSQHKTLRTFKLSRIKHIQLLDKCFVQDKLFDPYEYLGRAWSMIPEGRLYHVSLVFSPKVAKNVTEVQWHATQKYQFNEDKSATVEFRVDGIGEILWWILGYGDQVIVQSPKVLRDKIQQMAQNMVNLYTKGT